MKRISSIDTFWQLSTQNGKFLWVFQKLNNILQFVLCLLHSFDMLKCHILHLDGVDCRVKTGCGAEPHYEIPKIISSINTYLQCLTVTAASCSTHLFSTSYS